MDGYPYITDGNAFGYARLNIPIRKGSRDLLQAVKHSLACPSCPLKVVLTDHLTPRTDRNSFVAVVNV